MAAGRWDDHSGRLVRTGTMSSSRWMERWVTVRSVRSHSTARTVSALCVAMLGLILASCSSGSSSTSPAVTTDFAPVSTTAAAQAGATATSSSVAPSTAVVSVTPPPPTSSATTQPPSTTGAASTTGVPPTEPPPTLVAAADVPVAVSSACDKVHDAAGETTIPFTSSGLTGTYILHLPPGITAGTPLPLVLELHGYSEPAAVQELQSGLAQYGDGAGFVTALPQIDRPVPLWNWAVGSADSTYLGALLDQLEATVCIDTSRVFVAGLSNGAFMASTAACDLSDRVAAVATVAGIQAPAGCHPVRPVPVVAFHGTADTFVPYTGGLGSSVASLPNADGKGTIGTAPASTNPSPASPSVPARASTWAVRNGCGPTPDERPVAADVAVLRFTCPDGNEVELYRIDGGGHAWPGSAFSAKLASIIGATTMSIDATTLIWDFFAAHPRRR